MRERHRQHALFDVSLDGRQIAGVVAFALVSLAIVFVLGVSFGRRVAQSQPVAAAAPARAVETVSPPDTTYSFHEELRKTDVLAVPVPTPPPKAAAPTPAPAAPPVAPVAIAGPPPPAAKAVEPVAAPPEPKAAEPTRVGVEWTVQFGASERRSDADKLAAQLLDYGFASYVAVADIPGKGRYYRVRVGHFGGKDDADRVKLDVETKHRMKGVVMPSR